MNNEIRLIFDAYVQFYENDLLIDSFVVKEKALAIANAREFVKRKFTYRMCSLS